MRRVFTFVLALMLIVPLCACKKPASENPSANGTGETTGNQTESTGPSGNPSTTPTASSSADETTPTTPSGTTATEPSGTSATEPPETTAPVPTTCSHNFSGATCTAPKTCAKCGATEGSAIGHNWKDATCAAPKTCTVCGATEGGKGDHTYTADCAICGQPNADYVPVDESSWEYVLKEDGELTEGFYDFCIGSGANFVVIYYEKMKTLEKFSQEQNMTIDEIREQYTPLEKIKTIDGVEYVYDSWGLDDWYTRLYKEENGVVTVDFMSLDQDENGNEVWTVERTVVMKRTGMAEMTVTSSNYENTPVGTKLTGKPF